tara:strand:+ start:13604 stop:14308 length:705 start_codon:yes stop_codon:yes gene_type:complete
MDIIAWKKYPEYNWVYMKPNLCQLQNIKWWPCPVQPEKYPVVLRPMINLCGMGSEVSFINGEEEFDENSCYGYFTTPFLEGEHTSHDFDISNGEIIKETVFKGFPNKEYPGTFKYWELIKKNANVNFTKNLNLLLDKFKNYTGPLNIECIDGNIIEAHLREGDEYLTENYEIPLYLVPVWNTLEDNEEIDIENIKKQKGVIDVLKDSKNLSRTGVNLQRKALVITKNLPEDLIQ